MPKYLVWCPDQETREDAHTFDAYDPEMAAQEWADYDDRNSAEYSIASGSKAVVCVVLEGAPEDCKITWCSVMGEYDPVYYATELDGPPGPT